MTRIQFIAAIAVTLLCLSTIAFFKADDGFFVGNILPEMIGVCIELLIIIFVFDAWQKRDERDRKIKVERRLREFLIFFLKNNFKSFPQDCQPENFYGQDHDKNEKIINNLIQYITVHGLEGQVVLAVQRYCESQKEIFNNLIPVSSDLTNDHFKSWVRISYFMNAIVSRNEETTHAVIKILENIQRFDSESYNNHLYVGASDT